MSHEMTVVMRWIALAWVVGLTLLAVAVAVMLPTWIAPSLGPVARPAIFAAVLTVAAVAGLLSLYVGPPWVRRIVVVAVVVIALAGSVLVWLLFLVPAHTL
jgi:hypothetical protein